ncbi:MAG: DNA primase family protein [Clostridium sp.]|uniref:DNA primase family protein n=1 Tax=Clostridium sp. TaxID=1506 RepID=UPI003D6D8081
MEKKKYDKISEIVKLLFTREGKDEGKDFINIRAIPNKETSLKPVEFFVALEGDVNSAVNEVIEIIHKYRNYNIYYGPVIRNDKKGTAEFCTKASSLYVDFDEHCGIKFSDMDSLEREKLKKKLIHQLTQLGYEPSLIVNSGNGIHCYWTTKNVIDVVKDRVIFEGLLRYLANIIPEFKGDMAVCNVAHMLRLPCTNNVKDLEDIKPCEVICFNEETEYDFEKLAGLIKIDEYVSKSSLDETLYYAVRKLKNLNKDQVMDEVLKCDFMKQMYENPQDQSYTYWTFMASTLSVFGGIGQDIFLELSQKNNEYKEKEAKNIFNSMSKNIVEGNVGPVTCSKVCEEGFRCNLSCNKKSVAGNIFSKIINERKIIEKDKVINDAVRRLEPDSDSVKNLRKLDDFIANILNENTNEELIRSEYIKKAMKMLDIDGSVTMIKKLQKQHNTNDKNLYLEIGDEIMSTSVLVSIAKTFYEYEVGYYRAIEDEILKKKIIVKLGDGYTKSRVENILYYITSKTAIKVEDSNKNKKENMICLKNGMILISDKGCPKLLPHDSSYNCLNQLGIKYDKNAKCPTWLKFLDRTFIDERDKKVIIKALQEWLGYLLIPGNQLQKMLFLIGKPRTGKGVIQHIMTCIAGDENVTAYSIGELHDKVNAATLIGKLANIGGEIDATEKFKTSFIKMMIGEDKISGKALYKNPVSFQNEAKLIFAANQIPYIADRSSAMDERTLAIPVNNYVSESERDTELKSKLERELSGILNWAIEGRISLLTRGYFVESCSMLELKSRMREENNSVVYWFNNRNDSINESRCVYTLKEVFDNYKEFCIDEEIKPFLKKNFTSTLENIAGVELVKKTKPDQKCVCFHWEDLLLISHRNVENSDESNLPKVNVLNKEIKVVDIGSIPESNIYNNALFN